MSSAPNMATITASLERSLQNCSINNNHHQSQSQSQSRGGRRLVDELGRTRSTTSFISNNNNSDSLENHHNIIYDAALDLNSSSVNYYSHHDAALDLNSQISLPYHWEQCLDLKSGEIYYINWRTGMTAKEDPRTSHKEMIVGHQYDNYYSEEEEDDDDEEEDDSSSNSSSEVYSPPEVEAASASSSSSLSSRNEADEERNGKDERSRQVLVVAGCKVCLMYFMVPKQVQLCPKCTSAQLLHF